MSKLKIVAADGSMEPKVSSLMTNAGMPVSLASSRKKNGTVNEAGFIESFDFQRPFDIPARLNKGHYDLAIVGEDWIADSGFEFPVLYRLGFGRNGDKPVRIVVAAPKDSGITTITDLPHGCIVATEYTRLAKRFFEDTLKRPDIQVEFSPGNTEDKPRFGADAIIEIVDSGESLAANDLVIIHEIMKSSTVIAANSESLADPKKRLYIDHFVQLIEGAYKASRYVLVIANTPSGVLDAAAKIIGGLKSPSCSPLYGTNDWYAIQSIIPKENELSVIFDLQQIGVTDIIVIRDIPLIMM